MFPRNRKTKSDEDVLLREAVPSDAATLIEYVNTVAGESDFLTFGAGEFKKTIQEEEAILREHSNAVNQIFLVAELNGEIAGLLNVSASSKSRLKHIGDMGISVLKSHWGKGIGSQLIESMLEWARHTGVIRKINLNVQINNESAIALYEKFGFEIEGTIRRDSFIDRKFYDAYAMGISID